MKLVFHNRKPYPGVNFSIENLFAYVRSALPADIDWRLMEAKYFSRGFLKRLFISLQASFNQGDVNHITGDIHFIAMFLRKRRTVLTIHDVGFMQHRNRLVRWVLKMFWLDLPIRSVAAITTVSNATKTAVLHYVKTEPSRIKVIYNPVLPHFVKQPKVFNKNQPSVLQIGTKANKNIPRLVEALKGLNCRLEIIGPVTADLLHILAQGNLNFAHSADLSYQQIFEKYVAADILSFVSKNEGFGMPIVEANAVGRVVLTSNRSSMPEVAGDAGHLVDPFDVTSIRNGLIELIENDSYRDRLIANGYENCKRFDVRTIAGQYVELYRSLVN
jgi:glycosyltransferase involved in cell wall biosynthesis